MINKNVYSHRYIIYRLYVLLCITKLKTSNTAIGRLVAISSHFVYISFEIIWLVKEQMV